LGQGFPHFIDARTGSEEDRAEGPVGVSLGPWGFVFDVPDLLMREGGGGRGGRRVVPSLLGFAGVWKEEGREGVREGW
jgi:hypothetical protein